MKASTVSWILLVGGVILVLLGLTADVVGLGDREGIGYKQTAAIVVGLAAAVCGGVLVARARPERPA